MTITLEYVHIRNSIFIIFLSYPTFKILISKIFLFSVLTSCIRTFLEDMLVMLMFLVNVFYIV